MESIRYTQREEFAKYLPLDAIEEVVCEPAKENIDAFEFLNTTQKCSSFEELLSNFQIRVRKSGPGEEFSFRLKSGFEERKKMAAFRRIPETEPQHIREFNILVIGKVGVGKSSFINNLFGRRVSATGSIDKPGGVTKSIDVHEGMIGNVFLRVYDTPGFGDQTIDPSAWCLEFYFKIVQNATIDQLIFVHRGDWHRADLIDSLIFDVIPEFLVLKGTFERNIKLLFTHCDKADEEELGVVQSEFLQAFKKPFQGRTPECWCTRKEDQFACRLIEKAVNESKEPLRFRTPWMPKLKALAMAAYGDPKGGKKKVL